MKRKANLMNRVFLLLLLGAIAGCAESFDHDKTLASKRAVEFAEATFVRGNLDQGYAMMADKARSYVPLKIFTDKVNKMHPSGRPGKVAALSAEPVKGEKIMNITVRGEGDGQFIYNIAVIGTAATDYRVSTFSGGRSS